MWRKIFGFVRGAAIAVVLRKIFLGIIDHFGWGPILTAFALSIGAAAVAFLASLEWYWVLGSSLVIFVIGLTLATVLAGRYRREERVAAKAPSPSIQTGEEHILTDDVIVAISRIDVYKAELSYAPSGEIEGKVIDPHHIQFRRRRRYGWDVSQSTGGEIVINWTVKDWG